MNNNLKKRIISGFVLAFIFVFTLFFARILFQFFVFAIAFLMLGEWYKMTEKDILSLISGLFIIPFPIVSILILSEIDHRGWFLLLFFVSISTVDSCAMLGGKFFKGPKFAPKISPNKTISGLFCGMFGASLIPIIMNLLPFFDLSYILGSTSIIHISIATLILGFIAQISDLFISLFKRKFSIKDTGDIIPGHGGVLDRFDSYILTSPIILILIKSNMIKDYLF